MSAAVYVGGTDLTSIGAYVDEPVGIWSGIAREYQIATIPGRSGGVLAADPVATPRDFRIGGRIVTSANTIAARRTAEDNLKALLYNAYVSIVVDDGVSTTTRALDGVCVALDVQAVGHPVTPVVSKWTATVRCPDPTWRDSIGQLIAFTSTASAIPLGTAPCGGIVRIAAPSWSSNVVDPVLTYYSAAKVSIQSMTFSTTLTAATHFLEIDLDRATVTLSSSGTSSNGIALLSAGDFFALDPMDGDIVNSAYPYLAVTATSGTPSGTWAGVKRWL